MRVSFPIAGFVVLSAALVGGASAQQYATAVPPPPIVLPAGPNLQQQLAGLADQPATHTGFVIDRNMLQMAQGVLESQGMDATRAAAALKAVSVDNYRYQQPAFYTPEAMAALIDQYHAMHWQHLVNANQTPASTAQPAKTVTDMWLHFSGADVDGLTVLTRAPKMMTVVQVSCDLRPLDLLHLGGHFGIPKVDLGAVMVPAPR